MNADRYDYYDEIDDLYIPFLKKSSLGNGTKYY